MQFLGFGQKWVGWIHGCLYSAKALVLHNGSPMTEFQLERGSRLSDPLSLFFRLRRRSMLLWRMF